MLIIDSHLDLSWNALQWNRDLRQPVHAIRTHEANLTGPGRGVGTVALPELRAGRVALCFATLLARSTGTPVPNIDYASPAQAYGIAQGQLAYYGALAAQGECRIITTLSELNAHIDEWTQWESTPDSTPLPLGFLISMESADPIQTPAQLAQWQAAGVRAIGPAHYGPGRFASGTGTELGLTPEGVELIKEMDRLGVLLDLTHLSDAAFWQALEIYNGPVLASHNNCRALVPHQRQFSDDQLKAIFERGGVVGAALDNWMIQPGWERGVSQNTTVSLADVVDHIDHICQLAGNTCHAAIGSDLDGGFGREQSPHDLDTIADLQKFSGLLEDRGHSPDDIAAIMHGNWLAFLRRAWGNAKT
jgi:membrane dipeptidase